MSVTARNFDGYHIVKVFMRLGSSLALEDCPRGIAIYPEKEARIVSEEWARLGVIKGSPVRKFSKTIEGAVVKLADAFAATATGKNCFIVMTKDNEKKGCRVQTWEAYRWNKSNQNSPFKLGTITVSSSGTETSTKVKTVADFAKPDPGRLVIH